MQLSRFALLLLGALAFGHPGIAQAADADLGERIYKSKCRACHGPEARRGSGGDIRGTRASDVRDAIGGIEAMPEIQLSDDEVAAVTAYLHALLD